MLALDFLHLASSLSIQSKTCMGFISPPMGEAQSGFLLFALDFAIIGFLLSAQSFARADFSAFALDHARFGLLILIRSIIRLDLLMLIFSTARFDFTVSVLDFAFFESFPSSRSSACLESSISAYGLT